MLASMAVPVTIESTPRIAAGGPPAPAGEACCTTSLTEASLSEADAEQLAALLKAMAEPTRLRLLSLIAAHDGGEACVCDLTRPVALSQPTVSHHLRILVEAGLLTREKRGVWAYYRLVPERLAQAAAALTPDLAPAPAG
jgi:ArsR family transcriptional regulator, arsenate/arsenite/antimonite-responsive transcriptional repressor